MTKTIYFRTAALGFVFTVLSLDFTNSRAMRGDEHVPLLSKDETAGSIPESKISAGKKVKTGIPKPRISAEEEFARAVTDSFKGLPDFAKWVRDKTKKWNLDEDNFMYRMKTDDVLNALAKYYNKPEGEDNGYELGNLLMQIYLLVYHRPGKGSMYSKEFTLILKVLLKSLAKFKLPAKRIKQVSGAGFRPQDLWDAIDNEMKCIWNHKLNMLGMSAGYAKSRQEEREDLCCTEQLRPEDYKDSGLKDALEKIDTPPAEVLVRIALRLS